MSHIAVRATVVALLVAVGCSKARPTTVARNPTSLHSIAGGARSNPRAGIAIVGRGGVAGIQRTMVVDSATARYMTVTRRPCATCAPLDSASGTLATSDVAHIYAVVEEQRVFALREVYGVCAGCADQTLLTTAVFANSRRKVITSDGEATPDVLGRVHVAVAEAIRTARGVR